MFSKYTWMIKIILISTPYSIELVILYIFVQFVYPLEYPAMIHQGNYSFPQWLSAVSYNESNYTMYRCWI